MYNFNIESLSELALFLRYPDRTMFSNEQFESHILPQPTNYYYIVNIYV